MSPPPPYPFPLFSLFPPPPLKWQITGDTTSGLCHVTLNDPTCLECVRNCEFAGCEGRQCGSDGCSGNCGQCSYGTYCNATGQCIETNVTGMEKGKKGGGGEWGGETKTKLTLNLGTCTNPIKILEGSTNLTGVYTFTGTSLYFFLLPFPAPILPSSLLFISPSPSPFPLSLYLPIALADTETGFHYHVIPCNYASTAPEIVWSFTVPPGQVKKI